MRLANVAFGLALTCAISGCSGGGSSGSDSPTPTPSPTSSPPPTVSPSPTPGPTATASSSPTPGPTPSVLVDPTLIGYYTGQLDAIIVMPDGRYLAGLQRRGYSKYRYFLAGQVTGSAYDSVVDKTFFQAEGEALDTDTDSKIAFAISEGVYDRPDYFDPTNFSIGTAYDQEHWTGKSVQLGVNELKGEFFLQRDPNISIRIDETGRVTTAQTLPSVCTVSGQISEIDSIVFDTTLTLSGNDCPHVGVYSGAFAIHPAPKNAGCTDSFRRATVLHNADKSHFFASHCLRKEIEQ